MSSLQGQCAVHLYLWPPTPVMKRKSVKKDQIKRARALQRKLAKAQGFYDGRFKPKVVKDKKKEEIRKKARGRVKEIDD